MKRILLLLSLLLLFGAALRAQWRKVRDFDNPYGISQGITAVYFIDLPGPPRIGFVGTTWGGLWRTPDGGETWANVAPVPPNGGYIDYIYDICFKDSLTGWFSYEGGPSGVYRTEDGGKTWTLLSNSTSPNLVGTVRYCAGSRRLFLSREDSMIVSTDLGDDWDTMRPFVAGNVSFFSGLEGIALCYFSQDTNTGIIRTSDGGITWSPSSFRFPSNKNQKKNAHYNWPPVQPLCIRDTNICFAVSYAEVRVYRSDDFGQTWRLLSDLGHPWDTLWNHTAPYSNGIIHGDLSRLYIGTDSGMLVSTDQGINWTNVGGPRDLYSGYVNGFYANKGVTFAGSWTSSSPSVGFDGGLWEEDWPPSGVTQPRPAANISLYPNPTTGMVTIAGASGVDDGSSLVEVENVLGESVLTAISHATTPQPPPSPLRSVGGGVTLDLSRLPAGTYFVRVETSDGPRIERVVKSQ